MRELTAQIIKVDDLHCFKPYTLEDADNSKEYRLNQIVEVKIKGFNAVSERSLKQLNLFWKSCQVVADNSDNKHFDTKEKVAFQCKVALMFIDESQTIVTAKGDVMFKYRSIAVRNLKHLEACRFFDRAFDFLASVIGLTRDELISEIKRGIC